MVLVKREDEEKKEESGSEDENPPRQIFVDKDQLPICFYLHPSVTRSDKIHNLTNDIETRGGVVQENDRLVDTVIIDEHIVDREALQNAYFCHPRRSMRDTIVEPMTFVHRCIREGAVRHRLKKKEGMGGPSSYRTRVNYTLEDDQHLCRYIALKIPDPDAGGRTGNEIYEDLIRMGEAMPDEYNWTKRHTWQSWRERYKKNARRLDPMIVQFVKREKPTEMQRYYRDRRIGRGRLLETPEASSDDEVEIVEVKRTSMDREADAVGKPQKRRKTDRRSAPSAKKQRVDYTQRSVGKARVSSPGENDENMTRHSSLFTEDEPGPSTRRPTKPGSDNVARAGAHSSDPLFPSQSQKTLVGTQPGATPHSSRRTHRVPRSVNEPIMIPEDNTPPVLLDGDDPPPPTQDPQSPTDSVADLSSPSEDVVIEANRVMQEAPQARPLPMKRARRYLVVQQPETAEAPFRNTRSRSRSVEPTSLTTGSVSKKNKGIKRKKADQTHTLEPLREQSETEVLDNTDHDGKVTPAGETLEDEMDVENLLVGSVTENLSIPGELEPSHVRAQHLPSRSESLETDDAQTDDMLHQDPSKFPYPTSNFELVADLMNISPATSGPPQPQHTRFSGSNTRLSTSGTPHRARPLSGSSPPRSTDGLVDADDAETDRNLRQKSGQSSQSRLNLRPDFDPAKVLELFNKTLPIKSRSSRRPSARPSFPQINRHGATQIRSGASVTSLDVQLDRNTVMPQPRTPLRTRMQTRKQSTSSVESFPLVGTKASAVKKRIEANEKMTPYKPPAGTRAAKLR